eukprot:scaffold49115_cov43-Attheya_sp.AAC.1
MRPPPAPTATRAPAPTAAAPGGMSQADLTSRLKSLYSPAKKQTVPPTTTTTTSPSKAPVASIPIPAAALPRSGITSISSSGKGHTIAGPPASFKPPVAVNKPVSDPFEPTPLKTLLHKPPRPAEHMAKTTTSSSNNLNNAPYRTVPVVTNRNNPHNAAAAAFQVPTNKAPPSIGGGTSSDPAVIAAARAAAGFNVNSPTTKKAASKVSAAAKAKASSALHPQHYQQQVQHQQQQQQKQQQQQQQQQQRVQQQQQQQQQQKQPQRPAAVTLPGPSPSATNHVMLMQQQKQKKEKFLMFTRVLMKYLEQKDPKMHLQAKDVIKECAEKNKNKEAGYQSLTVSMSSRLRSTVGETYWRKAEDYLNHFLRQKMAQQRAKQQPLQSQPSTKPGTTNAPTMSAAPVSAQLIKEQQQQQQAAAKMSEIERKAAETHRLKAQRQTAMGAKKKETPNTKKRKAPNSNGPRRKMSKVDTLGGEGLPTTPGSIATTPIAAPPMVPPKVYYGSDGKPIVIPVGSDTKKRKSIKKKSPTTPGSNSKHGTSGSVSSAASTTISNTAIRPTTMGTPTLVQTTPMSPPTKATTKTTTMKKDPPAPPPREYNEFMESVDHAVSYDWTTAALLLGKEKKGDIDLNEEQEKLLYGERRVRPSYYPTTQTTLPGNNNSIPPTPTVAMIPPASSSIIQKSTTLALSVVGSTPQKTIAPAWKGWGKKNIVSTRVAWARIRLGEQPKKASTSGTGTFASTTSITTNAMFTAGAVKMELTDATKATPTAWFNEEEAENDEACALLSEATQVYLRQVLESAISAARQRQNIDGIRLWHQQHTGATRDSSSSSKETTPENKTKPPLWLRLGCNVQRQAALREGNAAKVYQRMEEALQRSGKPKSLKLETTWINSSSMSDLAKCPKLSEAAVQKADYDAKRSFETYGGKGSAAPPFGRVPKVAKLTTKDIIPQNKSLPFSRKRHLRTSSLSFL